MIDRICGSKWTFLVLGIINFLLGSSSLMSKHWSFFALNVSCVIACTVLFFLVKEPVPK
jgi:hypothetical protein